MDTLINYVTSKAPYSKGSWTAAFKDITEVVTSDPPYFRVNTEFSTTDFSFTTELKFHSLNFQTTEQIDQEIDRRLTRLIDYSLAIEQVASYLLSLGELEPSTEWKAALTLIETTSPVYTEATFTFYKVDQPSFTKTFILREETFISFEFYFEELNRILTQLNTPIEINYESLITKTTY